MSSTSSLSQHNGAIVSKAEFYSFRSLLNTVLFRDMFPRTILRHIVLSGRQRKKESYVNAGPQKYRMSAHTDISMVYEWQFIRGKYSISICNQRTDFRLMYES